MTDPRPTVKKVYVDPPTFTKDEEEEYRFVRSRLDDNEGDENQDTFRQIEMDNNYRDNNPVLSGSPLKQTELDSIRGKKAGRGFPISDRNAEMYSYGDAEAGQPDSHKHEARNHNLQRQFSPKPASKPHSVSHLNPPHSKGITMKVDELKQETEYQMILKERIKTNSKHDHKLDVHNVSKSTETGDPNAEGEDFVEDSLEFPQQPSQLNGYDGPSLEFSKSGPLVESGSHSALVSRDSISQYGDWKIPPPNPFSFRTLLQSDQNLRLQQKFRPDFIDDNDTAKMELLYPKEPKINFVETNKFDYGKPQDKSYQQINERRRIEEDNLENAFIKPKVTKSKVPKSLSKARPSQNNQIASPLLKEMLPLHYKPTSAEEYWAKQSAFLSMKKESKLNSGKSKTDSGKSSGSVRKAGSGANIPIRNEMSPRFQHLDPLHEQHPAAVPPPMEQGNQPLQIESEGGRCPIGLQYHQYGPPFEPVQQYEQQSFPYYQDTNESYMYRDLDRAGGMFQPRENDQADLYDSNKSLDDEQYPSTNPYPKIPPIMAFDQTSELTDIEGGYAGRYKKQREKDTNGVPQYKVYNLEDYKKMKRECQLVRGTLGPDLDNISYRNKMEKRQKQFEYARKVMEKNRHELTDKHHTSSPKSKNHTSDKSHTPDSTKRKIALEYARDIPKPTVRPHQNQCNSYEAAAQLSPASKTGGSPRSPNTVDVINLQKLQQRHEQDKQNVAMIHENVSAPVLQEA